MAKQEELDVRGASRGGNQRSIKAMLASKEARLYFNRPLTNAELGKLAHVVEKALVK